MKLLIILMCLCTNVVFAAGEHNSYREQRPNSLKYKSLKLEYHQLYENAQTLHNLLYQKWHQYEMTGQVEYFFNTYKLAIAFSSHLEALLNYIDKPYFISQYEQEFGISPRLQLQNMAFAANFEYFTNLKNLVESIPENQRDESLPAQIYSYFRYIYTSGLKLSFE